ncbi:hypothetical protein [Paenibacillus guangzhouensis]|nr:hypothetical protein [Paenibacillus guangzhouensis]
MAHILIVGGTYPEHKQMISLSAGIIRAIQEEKPIALVGTLKPWHMRL